MRPRPAAARVRRTGIALVHEGEYVVARAGAEALFDSDGDASAATARPRAVHLHLPVEIEVVLGASGLDLDEIADHVLSRLSHGLDGVEGG
jgi:hypothetical protein